MDAKAFFISVSTREGKKMFDIEPPDMSYFRMNITEIMMQYSEQSHIQRDMYIHHGFEHAYHGTHYICTCMFL